MKEEKEFSLMVKLLNSPYVRGELFKKPKNACKKDLEKYLGYSEKNKEFRAWIEELIDCECLEPAGIERRGLGKKVDVFVVNIKNLEKRLLKNSVYKESWRVFSDNALFGILGGSPKS